MGLLSRWEVAGLPNSAAGLERELRPLIRRRHTMPTEEHNSGRPHQDVPQGVLALMPPLRILATTVGAALLVWGLLFVYISSPAWANTINVDTLADEQNTNTQCSLREAIINANADDQSGSSDCEPGIGDDVINIAVTGTVNLTAVLPDLSTNIEIVGPGADQFTVTRPDTAENFRIFTVSGDTTVVSISGMTISNGNVVDGTEGGGILIADSGTLTVTDSTISGNFTEDGGGGIGIDFDTNGTLTVTGSTITDNSTNSDGGGIFNGGTLTVTDSTISGNTSGPSSFGGEGGGIYSTNDIPDTDPTNDPDETTTITNSTISGNTAAGEPGIGGGVYNSFGLTVIENSTITLNTAPDGRGSGVASRGNEEFASTEVLSSIISENTNTDVDFLTNFGTPTNTFLSRGYNLIGDGNATGAFNQAGDQTGVADPGLGALADNGGPTQTHALLTGSPAIDKGPPSTSCPPPDTDQRGVSRPQGSACDIGSFELEEPDTQAPKVISTFPRNGGEVGPAVNVTATFSEDMREASVMNAFKLFKKGSTNQIAAAVTYNAATDIATLNPTNNLKRGATYKAVVTTVAKDMAGNRLDQDDSKAGLQQKVWFFEID
jgi:CSLREA domain-containing protein